MSTERAPGDSREPSASGAAELIKIGEFARLAGTNLRTLRYYEELGLLSPAVRSAGGFRYYRAGDLGRMRMIASLQQLGLELARVRELMDTRGEASTRSEFFARVRNALEQQSALFGARILELEARKRSLGGEIVCEVW